MGFAESAALTQKLNAPKSFINVDAFKGAAPQRAEPEGRLKAKHQVYMRKLGGLTISSQQKTTKKPKPATL